MADESNITNVLVEGDILKEQERGRDVVKKPPKRGKSKDPNHKMKAQLVKLEAVVAQLEAQLKEEIPNNEALGKMKGEFSGTLDSIIDVNKQEILGQLVEFHTASTLVREDIAAVCGEMVAILGRACLDSCSLREDASSICCHRSPAYCHANRAWKDERRLDDLQEGSFEQQCFDRNIGG